MICFTSPFGTHGTRCGLRSHFGLSPWRFAWLGHPCFFNEGFVRKIGNIWENTRTQQNFCWEHLQINLICLFPEGRLFPAAGCQNSHRHEDQHVSAFAIAESSCAKLYYDSNSEKDAEQCFHHISMILMGEMVTW